jgi:hypothetical protein
MARSRLSWYAIAMVAVATVNARPVRAQDWFVDWSIDQSFSSSDPYRSPRGFTAGLGGIAVVGPFGFHVSYSRVSDSGEDVLQDCLLAPTPCVPGPLSTSFGMRTAGIGVSYDFVNPTDVMLTLSLTGTKSWHTVRHEHLATGDRSESHLASNLGFSGSAQLRLRPVFAGIRPELTVHYDHGGRGEWGGRNAFGFSAGLGWVLRRPHEY